MTLPDIPDDLMARASAALDAEIKASGDPVKARAAFEAVLKGGEPEPEVTTTTYVVKHDGSGVGKAVVAMMEEPAKPARKPRSDKGKPRKQAPPRPEDLSIAQGLELVKQSEEDAKKAAKQRAEIGARVIDLIAALKGAMK